MSDKIYLGNRLADLDIGEPSLPVSKVILNVDSQVSYVSGDDTGSTIEQSCPWATQAMADSVLAKLKGFVYKPFTGTDALLDPAAELGDAITVGGTYSVLAQMGRNLDRQGAATIGAPGTDEIEDEYPYKPKQRKETDRVLAKAYSRISKTAEEIRLEVEDELNNLSASFSVSLESITAKVQGLDAAYTELSVTVDGVTVTDASGTTRIKGSSIETETLKVSAANITGTLTADQIDATGLEVDAANITGSLTIGQLPTDVATEDQIPIYTSELINDEDFVNETGVVSIIDGTVTADYIEALGVSAKYLQGRYVYLLDSAGDRGGRVSITNASTADCAVTLTSYGALDMYADEGDIYLEDGAGEYLHLSTGDEAVVIGEANLISNRNGLWDIGDSSHVWNDTYLKNEPTVISDLTKKHDVAYGLERFDEFFDGLKPMSFVFDENTSNRTHHGLGAQDVEQNLLKHGFTSMDFAGLIKSPKKDEDGNVIEDEYDYALRYGEFIPMLIDQVQRLKHEVAKLKAYGG